MNSKITDKKLLNFIFGLETFMAVISPSSVFGKFSLILFCSMSISMALSKRIFKLDIYLFIELVFLIFGFYQIISGIPVDMLASQSRLTTLIYSLIYNISVLNYIICIGNFKKVIWIYCKYTGWGMLFLLVDYYKSLLLYGRFSTNDATLSLFGSLFGGFSSTSISMTAIIAFSLILILYWGNFDKKTVIIESFWLFIIAITGSRKVLLLVIALLIAVPYYKDDSKRSIKILKYLVSTVVICLIGYFMVMKIPYLYEQWGERLQKVLLYYVNGEIDDASIKSRSELIALAANAFDIKPITGWGLDNFSTVINNGGYYAHNNFFELLSTCGIIGFSIYYFKYIVVFIRLCRVKNLCNNDQKAIANSFIIMFFGMLILEYWQVTYCYRNMTISNIFFVGYVIYIKTSFTKMKSNSARRKNEDPNCNN